MEQSKYVKKVNALLNGKNEIQMLEEQFSTGSMRITVFPITTGIFLSLNEVAGTSIPFDENIYKYEMTTINQCISGRCEFKHPEEAVSYISPQLTCIARKRRMDSFHYPLGNYTGLEISIVEALLDENTKKNLDQFSIDIDRLLGKYLNDTETYIGRTDNKLQVRFKELYQLLDK